jgi:hypothetical protein
VSLILPLTDPPPEHPAITAMRARFARKAERVLHDPVYRAQQPIEWWATDLQAIRDVAKRHAADSSLDPWSKTVELPHSDDYDQRFRFQRWPIERQFWLQHLPMCEDSPSRVDRWETCGRRAALWHDDSTDRYVLRSDTCKLRICPACRRRYQFAAVARIRALLQDAAPRSWQFITLTVRHTRAPLAQQTEHLKASFRRLRQRKLWRAAVAHGYAVLEITYNRHRDEWHPHLHVLARCRYIDWHLLRKDWIAVTDGSSIIDCGYVRTTQHACDYVARYLAKPPDLLDLQSPQRIAEYYFAIQHARFLMPFGSPPKAPTRPALDTPRKLTYVGRLSDLHTLAKRGDLDAARTLRKLAHQDAAVTRRADMSGRTQQTWDICDYDLTDPLEQKPLA